MIEIVILVLCLPVIFFVCYRLFKRFLPFLFGNGIRLSKEQKAELKDIEYRAYVEKSKELVRLRGESKAKDEYGV